MAARQADKLKQEHGALLQSGAEVAQALERVGQAAVAGGGLEWEWRVGADVGPEAHNEKQIATETDALQAEHLLVFLKKQPKTHSHQDTFM